MAALTEDILENHGFMADVIKVGVGGPSVSGWIGRVVAAVGGFVGDVRLPGAAGPLRVAVAMEIDARPAGEDIDPLVITAMNRLFDGMENRALAREVYGVVRELRRFWLSGPSFECSVDGCGISIDFVRGRHRVDFGAMPGVLYVHGMTLVGRGFDPSSPVVEIAPDGSCRLVDGSVVHAGTLTRVDRDSVYVELAEVGEAPNVAGGLSARIMKARAGSVTGPTPSGCVISKGEDGNVLIVVEMPPAAGALTLRLLPSSVQIAAGGAVVFQAECGEAAKIAERTAGRRVSVACLVGAAAEVATASVEIRTGA